MIPIEIQHTIMSVENRPMHAVVIPIPIKIPNHVAIYEYGYRGSIILVIQKKE